MDQAFDLPTTFGDYEVLEELARGSASVILRARQRSLDRAVALKVLRGEPDQDPTERNRFLQGARAAARLDHPHVVRIFDVGRQNDWHYCAMALVVGESVAQRVASCGAFAPREAAKIARQTAAAAAYAHGQRSVHRGLSPTNVLIDADGNVRVTGFGLARRTKPARELSAGDARLAAFAAPELAAGASDAASPAADLYGIGGILYFALTGRPPSTAAIVEASVVPAGEAAVVRPSHWNAKIPRDLDAICLRCLARTPTERFPTAQLVVAALDEFLHSKPPRRRWLGGRATLAVADSEPASDARDTDVAAFPGGGSGTISADSDKASRSRVVSRRTILAALLLLVAGSCATWKLWQSEDGRADQKSQVESAASSNPAAVESSRSEPSDVSAGAQGPLPTTADDSKVSWLHELSEVERRLVASLTADGWNMDYGAAAEQYESRFRQAGLELDGRSTRDFTERFDEREAESRRTILDALTRWECYATAARRPEEAKLRKFLGILEDDAWGQQFLAARADSSDGRLLTLAKSASETPHARVESNELLIEALFARRLQKRPETLALAGTVRAKFRQRVWSNVRLAELRQSAAQNSRGLERFRQIVEISGYLREAQVALGGENSGLAARIAAIERLDTPLRQDRDVAISVLRRGGAVMIVHAADLSDWLPIHDVDELPTTPFRVVGVSLTDTAATDEDLPPLGELAHLRQVFLHRCPVTDEGVRGVVEAAPALNILGLDETAIRDATLPHLAKLSVATVRGTAVSAEACRRMTETSSLELLHRSPLAANGDAPPDHENGAVWFGGAGHVETTMTLPAGPMTWEALVTLPCELLPVSSRLFTCQNEQVELSLSIGDHRRPHSILGMRPGAGWRIMPPTAGPLPFDRPCHVAMVVDTMSIRCYVEGRKTGTIASPQFAGRPLTFNLATWPARIGKFTGVLDELRISSGARYDDDFATVARFESDDRTQLLYHFDESDGDVVLDASGHDHHGKLVGRTKRVISAPYASLSADRLPEVPR